jgi:prolyl 4-hydroxylase
MARPNLSASSGFNVLDGTETITNYRTSEHTFLTKKANPLIASLEERVSRYSGFPVENQEGIQIAHYRGGTYYKPHWDYVDPKWSGVAGFLSRGGNRVITFMIYLNTIPEGKGGETHFNLAGVSVKPDAGKACIWYNLFPNMDIDKSTQHEGRPPLEPYEKWIATIWIRERTFT